MNQRIRCPYCDKKLKFKIYASLRTQAQAQGESEKEADVKPGKVIAVDSPDCGKDIMFLNGIFYRAAGRVLYDSGSEQG